MAHTPDPVQPARGEPGTAARWLAGIGFFLVFGSGALAARLIWEMTVWSWERGPQMVGFRLVHSGGAILLFFPILLICWLLITVLYLARQAWRNRKVSRACLIAMALSVIVLGVQELSYGFWLRLFVERLVKGPYAGDFLVQAAAVGDLATVETFVAHGLSPNARNRRGQSALNGAGVGRSTRVIQYLISVGADASTLPRISDEQAKKIIDEAVREGIERKGPLPTDPPK
jgi:hypothetical protein